MGFMDGLKRFIQGKPVFEVPPQTPAVPASPVNPGQNTGGNPAAANGPKILPLVYVERADSNNTIPHLECDVHIRNHSPVPVRLERLEMLGQHFNLNKTYLQPSQEWQYQVYGPSRPISAGYHEAKLFYETENGDDFCSVHNVEYVQLPDHTYAVVRLHFLPPIRDV